MDLKFSMQQNKLGCVSNQNCCDIRIIKDILPANGFKKEHAA